MKVKCAWQIALATFLLLQGIAYLGVVFPFELLGAVAIAAAILILANR
jgi:hypothetical protein